MIDTDALLKVAGTPAGRRVLWDILAITGVDRQPYVAGDPEATAFKCGALNVGLAIKAEILEHCPQVYATMAEEVNDENEASE